MTPYQPSRPWWPWGRRDRWPGLLTGAILAACCTGCSVFGESAPEVSTASLSPDGRQQDLLKANIGQPGDPVLGTLYREINARHFGGALPATAVRWEPKLAEVGVLAARAFTLEGMFGHIGPRTVILLDPKLQADDRALRRALCHEIVHAYLYSTGDTGTTHGAAFQDVLHRLANEGAFEGIPGTSRDRANLRAWLDTESARLDSERESMDRLGDEIERERAEVERALAALTARVNAANAQGSGWPSPDEVAAINARRDAYNRQATEANARAERDRADLGRVQSRSRALQPDARLS